MPRTSTTSIAVAALLFAAGATVFSTAGALAGPLTPPAGPVAPTGKTIAETEPRIALSDENTPGDNEALFKITAPGSYYLTGDVTGVSGKHGVCIKADDVTLDLMGFSFAGVENSLAGIFVDGLRRRIEIRNGTVRDWGGAGIDASRQVNIDVFGAREARIVDVTVAGNGGDGVAVFDNAVVDRVVAENNGGGGIVVADVSVVERCVARGNTASGIATATSSVVRGCTSLGNGEAGVSAGSGTVVTETSTNFNDVGIVTGSSVTVRGCVALSNGRHGIDASTGSMVVGNTCQNNGTNAIDGAGIIASAAGVHIKENHVVGNDIGIRTTGGSFMVTNTSANHAPNAHYVFTATDLIGDIFGFGGSGGVITNTSATWINWRF